MNAHVDVFQMPLMTEHSSPIAADYWFELQLARSQLLLFQRALRSSRIWRVSSAIKHWETKLVQAIDRVFEAQENWNAARRHFV